MNITLNEKNIEKIQSSYEIIILNKIKYLSPQEQELFRNINFFKKSFNTHFDMKNKRLYISCLKFEKENQKTAFATAIRFIKNLNIKDIKIDIFQSKKELKIQTIIEGLILGNYEFLRYKSEKNEEKTKNIPIIFLSGKDSSQDVEQAYECGGIDYVVKPFITIELITKVNSYVRLKRLEDRFGASYV